MSDVSQGPGWWQASDGRWYPPQPAAPTAAPPPPAYGPPPAPQWTPPPAKKGGNKGCLIALAVVGVVVVLGIVATVVIIAAVADEVDDRVDTEGPIRSFSDNTENPPADDADIAECGPDPANRWMRASVDVLNHSSEASNYIIHVVFESQDGGEQLDSAIATVNGLGADQRTRVEASTFRQSPNDREFACRIDRVERFAA